MRPAGDERRHRSCDANLAGRALQGAVQHVTVQAVRRFLLEQSLEPVIRLEQLGGPVTRDGLTIAANPLCQSTSVPKAVEGDPSMASASRHSAAA